MSNCFFSSWDQDHLFQVLKCLFKKFLLQEASANPTTITVHITVVTDLNSTPWRYFSLCCIYQLITCQRSLRLFTTTVCKKDVRALSNIFIILGYFFMLILKFYSVILKYTHAYFLNIFYLSLIVCRKVACPGQHPKHNICDQVLLLVSLAHSKTNVRNLLTFLPFWRIFREVI